PSERDSVNFDVLGTPATATFGYYSLSALPAPPGGGVAATQATFTPLDQGGAPSGWGAFGTACGLTMESAGATGPYVVAEVTGGGCLPYPAYCDSAGCAAKVGTTHLILDVLGVIGGSGN